MKWLWLLYYFHSILSLVYLFLLSWVRCVMDISVNFHLRDLNILVPNSAKLPFTSNKFSSANDQGNLAQLPFVISAGYFAVCFVFLRFYCRRCHLQTCSWLSLYWWYIQKRKRRFKTWLAIIQLTRYVERTSAFKMGDAQNFQGQRSKNYCLNCALVAALAGTALWTSSGLRIRILTTAFMRDVALTNFRSCYKLRNLVAICRTALLKNSCILFWHLNDKSWATFEKVTKKVLPSKKWEKGSTQSK